MNLVSELDLPEFDYTKPDFSADTYHVQLARIRQQHWLARSPLAYIVLDHDSGEFFLSSKATAFPGRQIAEFFGVTGGPLTEHIDANILNLTGERHRRLRALAGPAFTARAADRWRPVMRGLLQHLWARVEAYGGCDFIPAIARPYSSLTIATVLGAPHQDAGRLHEWSSWVQRQFDIRALELNLPEIERAVKEVHAYVTGLLEDRRAEPRDDLITALLQAQDGGDKLSADECANLVVNLLAGGIDTVAGQLAHAIRLFAAHPAQWDLLAERPVLAAGAVDEVLRFEPVTPFTARICLADIEHRGVCFPAGTIIAICAERANREVHAGERFDITAPRPQAQANAAPRPQAQANSTPRPQAQANAAPWPEAQANAAPREPRLLTFGAGPHYCLGVNLARAELEEALAFLAPRTPSLALGGPPQLGGVEGIYGIDKLRVIWS